MSQGLVPAIAVLMLAIMLVPGEVWSEPEIDARYDSFDPNLVYVSEQGTGSVPGTVSVTADALAITAVPGSQPTVHLLTTRFDRFRAEMNLRILGAGAGSEPLRIGIWSPRSRTGYFLDFSPRPAGAIRARLVEDGTARKSLVGGEVADTEDVGFYALGQEFHLDLLVDKAAGNITGQLTAVDNLGFDGIMLVLLGGPSSPEYADVISDLIPVDGGTAYRFGGLPQATASSGGYKISLQWLDKDKNHLGFEGAWQRARDLVGNTPVEAVARAPAEAAFARVLLGSTDGSVMMFGNLFMTDPTTGTNLLKNPEFEDGLAGWKHGTQPVSDLQLLDLSWREAEFSIDATKAPDLFDSRRLTLTLQSGSTAGIASVAVENYHLTLYHQRFYGVKIDDVLAKSVLMALLAAGGLLVAIKLYRPAKWKLIGAIDFVRRGTAASLFCRDVSVPAGALVFGVAATIVLVCNVALFSLGNHPFDMTAAEVWVYVGATRGPAELYYLTNTVTLAQVWDGGPWHEAAFPYGPSMAYLMTGIGWVHSLFLNGPGSTQAYVFPQEFVFKLVNTVAIVAGAALTWGILQRLGASRWWNAVGTALFLFNPAFWINGSIWGQNHLLSVLPLLGAMYMVERRSAAAAWFLIIIAAFTRPQVLVLSALLGFVLLGKFSLRENVRGASWGAIIVFLLLAPLSLTIGPSLPLDAFLNVFQAQERGGNEQVLGAVSLNAFTIWPLVTYLFEGASGSERFAFSRSNPFLGGFSYAQVSLMVSLATVLLCGLALLVRRKTSEPGRYVPWVALGTTGFLLLKTGLVPTHMVLALPFLILCAGRLPGWAYFTVVGLWSFSALVSQYGALGLAIEQAPHLAPALHSSANALTRLLIAFMSQDWSIHLGVMTNVVAALLVLLAVTGRLKPWMPKRSDA